MSQQKLELPPVSHRCPKCRDVFHEAFTCSRCQISALPIDVWRRSGDWLVSGGIRVTVSEGQDLVLRYQERDFFTQVRMSFDQLSELTERLGFEVVEKGPGAF